LVILATRRLSTILAALGTSLIIGPGVVATIAANMSYSLESKAPIVNSLLAVAAFTGVVLTVAGFILRRKESARAKT
jgi:small neutral amino acid transporter SnatA (MarC family)